MMNTPLTMRVLMERGPLYAADTEIVSKTRAGIHRYTYADMGRRAKQLANALAKLGVKQGDRVATLAWNSYRHLEIYYAVPCMGAVLHTLNLRLSAEHLAYIINHAEDSVICVDDELLPLLERIGDQLTGVKHFIVMSGVAGSGGQFTTKLGPAHNYEDLIGGESTEFSWPEIDENAPMGLCYTSGTTGNPKGAMYTHRSNYLHTVTQCMTDSMGVSGADTVMAVVPMFHANAWGLPYSGCTVGFKQVFPGPTMDGASICQLLQDEKVTFTAGVPTIWMGVKAELEANPGKYDLSNLRAMTCGGSAPPRALIDWFETTLNLEFVQAWGMTETSPLGSVARLKAKMKDWPRDKQLDVKQRCGVIAPGLEVRVADINGNEIAHDGAAMGKLLVRGPWITSEYYKADAPERFPDGWFDTGDIATMDAEGYLAIADRDKDVIKSGGEWISSVDLENAIMAVPGVAEAAVIGVNHIRWQERPLACVVLKPGAEVTHAQINEHLVTKAGIAKWWLPDEIAFVEAIPKTSVGKFDKKVIREQYKDKVLTTA
ncbi:MAG: long-chain fatty acid--CoA ligase [Acidobacteria bacterium]|nr:long-chain fatty acid--CoA ligase [Acidobacteriota bacterium]